MPQGVSTYAVNLASSTTPFAPEALAAAAKTGALELTSPKPWSTNSAGIACAPGLSSTKRPPSRHSPTRAANYPKAWVAISDDDTLNEVGTPTAWPPCGLDARRSQRLDDPEEIKQTLKQAKDAFRRKNYARRSRC